MKFTTALPEFQKHLQTAIQAVPPKSTLPVLENFHFVLSGNQLQITSTDQELTIISLLEVDGAEDGAILAPARKLFDIVKALGNAGRITISCDKKNYKITLKTDFGEYTLHGLDANEFPSVPEFSTGTTIRLTAEEAMNIARVGSFAASKDEYRPAMTGMLLQCETNRINAVTTDGFRLVRVVVRSSNGTPIADQKMDVIIPVRAIDLLKKVDGDLTILVSPTHAKFVTPGSTVITRIIDEKFPPYESVIPLDNDKTARFTLSELASSVKRVSLFANTNTKQLRFVLEGNKLMSVAEDVESGNKGQEEISCDFGGARFEIGFNYRYIEEAMSHLLSDVGASSAVMTFSTPNKAVLIKPIRDEQEADDVLMLVMPVRL